MLARKAFFSFTGITDKAKHRAYNEWHQLDHRPENLALPGVVWGERWVHSPDCAARATYGGTAVDATHYINLYWYREPYAESIKEWQDLVLEHGWAYGKGGTQLRGKITFNAITTGGPASAYQKGGYNRFSIRELLAPWDQTAYLCGMRFLAPFAVHGALKIATDADVADSRTSYRRLIEALRDERIDLDAAAAAQNLAVELDRVLRREVA